MQTMYNAQVNSPSTTLNGDIDNSTNIIIVVDGSILPNAPNLLTIDYDNSSTETVLMTNKVGNTLTVTRAIEGSVFPHLTGASIARLFTAKDLNDIQSNIFENQVKSVIVSFDFGNNTEETYVETIVTGQSWITSNSKIVVSLYGEDVGDRSAEDGILEGIILSTKNIINGVGFTLMSYAPHGANGIYKAICTTTIN